ncbi:jg15725 [Pararge aegeria aegeria]|uniref:Jg15725 protein n=1 Tax=Pararge aegeria aegeria TaxID=348720 RepID=A0A8S4SEC6_9NEOP|nr:jg15725 [Pararge aegeria aegeria]
MVECINNVSGERLRSRLLTAGDPSYKDVSLSNLAFRKMESVTQATLLIAISLLFLGQSRVRGFEPQSDIGYPAGLIPECPGVTKNASITPVTMKMLQIIVQRVSDKGQVIRKQFPILTAHRNIAKDKSIDFKNRKTVLYAVGFLDSSVFPQSQAVGNAYSKRGYNVLITETFSFLTYIYPK